jgi:hypothetical protein
MYCPKPSDGFCTSVSRPIAAAQSSWRRSAGLSTPTRPKRLEPRAIRTPRAATTGPLRISIRGACGQLHRSPRERGPENDPGDSALVRLWTSPDPAQSAWRSALALDSCRLEGHPSCQREKGENRQAGGCWLPHPEIVPRTQCAEVCARTRKRRPTSVVDARPKAA